MTWEEHWASLHTPWDAGASPPALAEALLAHAPGPGRAIVSGCGRGHDVFTLAQAGFEAFGLDLAPSAVGPFEKARTEAGVDATRAHIVIGDFFTLQVPPADLVWDYTFLCALGLDQREAWADRMTELVKPGGSLWALAFPEITPGDDYSGPPWPLHAEQIEALITPRGFVVEGVDRPRESHPGREGKERLVRARRAS